MVQIVFGANEQMTAIRLNQATQGFKFLRRATFAGSQASPVGSGATAVACGTWTPGSGTSAIFVRACGPGGGGGSAVTSAGVVSAVGGGGGGGGYSEKWILSGFGGSQVVKIGLGGTGAGIDHVLGGVGAPTQFGALLSAGPGTGGTRLVNVPSSGTYYTIGGNGGVGSLGDINAYGAPGAYGFIYSGKALSGHGGQSAFGGAGGPEVQGDNLGQTGRIFGGGGSGASVEISEFARSGGAGAAGFVTIDEYA